MAILSIQSSVTWGHVGNAAAVFALQRLGFEVWPVDTVRLSNHPGYGHATGGVVPAGDIQATVGALERLGAFRACRGVITGYAGTVANGRAALAAVRSVKAVNAQAIHVCDPVMGDTAEGLYVAPDLVAFFKNEALAAADVITPNVFELGLLAGMTIASPEEAVTAAHRVLGMGPGLVLATSVPRRTRSREQVGVVLASRNRVRAAFVPVRMCKAKGAGDLLAALFLGQWLKSGDPFAALEPALAAVTDLIVEAERTGARELPLLAAQDRLLHPKTRLRPFDIASAATSNGGKSPA